MGKARYTCLLSCRSSSPLCSSPSLPPFTNHTGVGLTLAPVILMILSLSSQGMCRQIAVAFHQLGC